MLARRRAQGKQPLLGGLQLLRIEMRRSERFFQPEPGRLKVVQRSPKRGHRRFKQRRSARRFPIQATQQGRQFRHRRGRSGDDLKGFVEIAGDLFRLHQHLPLIRQPLFLARFRRQRFQFA